MKSKKVFKTILTIVFVIGILIPTIVAAFAFAERFQHNDDGQTYGSGYVEDPTQAYTPDLILAEGLDGTIGYVYDHELSFGPFENPKNEAERMAYNEQLLELAYEQLSKDDPYLWYIPLY